MSVKLFDHTIPGREDEAYPVTLRTYGPNDGDHSEYLHLGNPDRDSILVHESQVKELKRQLERWQFERASRVLARAGWRQTSTFGFPTGVGSHVGFESRARPGWQVRVSRADCSWELRTTRGDQLAAGSDFQGGLPAALDLTRRTR